MGDTSTESPTGILALWNDCKTGEEFLYEKWYQGEHLHDPGEQGRIHLRIDGLSAGQVHHHAGRVVAVILFFTVVQLLVQFEHLVVVVLDGLTQRLGQRFGNPHFPGLAITLHFRLEVALAQEGHEPFTGDGVKENRLFP